MEEGYIKLNRCIKHNWLWSVREPFDMRSAWIDLLLLANWRDVRKFDNGKFTEFKSGTVHRSILELAERWRWDRKKVKRFLSLLESDEMVSVSTSTHGTTITIVNWGFYQNQGTTDGTMNVATTAPTTPHKEERKEREEYIILSSSKDSESIRPTETVRQGNSEDVQKVVDAWNELIPLGVSGVSKMSSTSTRYKNTVARLKQYSLGEILTAIEKTKNSDFLLGRKTDFKVTYDWFIKPNNFPKVLDGNYNNKERGEQTQDWSWLDT